MGRIVLQCVFFLLLHEITLIIELCISEEIKHFRCAVIGKQSSVYIIILLFYFSFEMKR